MRCNAPIDSMTGESLTGERLKLARAVGRVSQCEQELNEDDVFCPRCGSRVVHSQKATPRHHAKASREDDAASLRPHAENVSSNHSSDFELGKELGELLKPIKSLPTLVAMVIVGIWGWGAFNAHDDVANQRPIGRILKRMYGSEFNSLTRHGYRMYIKHFTTTDPDKKASLSDLSHAVENTWRETCEDARSHFTDREDNNRQELLRLRERAADAFGDALEGR